MLIPNLLTRTGLRFLFVSIMLGLPPAGQVSAQRVVKERFNPDGSFWIHGTPPAEFVDIGAINLNSRRLPRLPSAGVELVGRSRLGFKSLTVKRERLVFKTIVVRGISYSFTGHFLKGGVFGAGTLDPDEPVLEGTLTKWRGGRVVAEANLKFTYFGGT